MTLKAKPTHSASTMPGNKVALVHAERSPNTLRQPRHDDIRALAFRIYQARTAQGRPGDPHDDWLKAEAELRAEALLRGDA